MLSHRKWARTGLAVLMVAALLLGGLAWAAKPPKPPPPPPPPPPPITYSVTYLGGQFYAIDINNDGVVVGYCGEAAEMRAFVSYVDNTGQRVMEDLNDLVEISEFPPEYVLRYAPGINNHGQIVGMAWVPGDESTRSSFRFTPGYSDGGTFAPGLVEDFGDPNMIGDWAKDINDSGDVIGIWQDPPPGNYRGYLYSDSDLDDDEETVRHQIDIGDLGDGDVRPQAINNLGQVVGYFEREGGSSHAFAYSLDGGMTPIVFGETDRGFFAFDINDSGFAVGLATHRYEVPVNKNKSYFETDHYAFRYDTLTGERLHLGYPEGTGVSQAFAINSSGDIVGSGFAFDNSFLYISDLGEIWKLDTLTGVQLEAHPECFGINDSGQICGYSYGLDQAYLLTPEPSGN